MSAIQFRHSLVASTMAGLATLIACTALAAGTPEQKCEAGKNDAAGKYAACVAKAEKGLITSGDVDKYNVALAKCESKIIAVWSKLEAAAAAAATTCPTTGDQSPIEDFVSACSESVATALAGGTLGPDPISCAGDLSTCDADLATCDADLSSCVGDLGPALSDLATCEGDLETCLTDTGRLHKTGQTICYDDAGLVVTCAGTGYDGEYQAGDAPSFVDNGDGTITDYLTGLMWEKLSDDGSIHDKDNQYAGLTAAIGKATAANAATFAGYTDWRVPNVHELGSIFDYELFNMAVPAIFRTPCTSGCTVLTCSCTKSNVYFTSTTYVGYPQANWNYNATDGDMYAGYKTDLHYARLVRSLN